jgi:hydroxyacylglutathione hydrolase
MPEPVRILPIACPFGRGGTVYVYYLDAPQPALIDTGVAASPSEFVGPALAAAGLRVSDVRWILASHGHWDHIGGARTALDLAADDAQLALHSADAELLRNRRAHVGGYAGMRFRYVDDPAGLAQHDAMLMENLSGELIADRDLAGGEHIDLGGGVTLSVVHTPGHSPGSVSFVLDGPEWAFTGDSVQVCGIAGGFPLVPDPVAYRASMRHLLEDVHPRRLYLGHHFADASGTPLPPPVDGDAVATALRDSLEMEARMAAAATRMSPQDGIVADVSTFAPAAAALGYDPDRPDLWPPSLFATLSAYLPPQSRAQSLRHA